VAQPAQKLYVRVGVLSIELAAHQNYIL